MEGFLQKIMGVMLDIGPVIKPTAIPVKIGALKQMCTIGHVVDIKKIARH